MPTTFRFAPDQVIQLDSLRTQSRASATYVSAYQYILDILDPPGINFTKPRNDPAVGLSYNWFVGVSISTEIFPSVSAERFPV